ncbi:MAG: hypothetical protein BVN35_20070 [Proteobacteria bacterium ST_bin11]|nr:MAG: hypothetical protein BVN35_20070 [Proteobacteria bacterium ST_bin11]
MKRNSLAVCCILPVLCGTACTSLIQPDASVSESVIESVLPINQPEQPWRLDNAWQQGGLGGSALRVASVEHVVRQVDQPFRFQVATANTADELMNTSFPQIPDDQDDDSLAIERAWRKYCHHQLDMTPEEQALIKHIPIPHNILNHGCNPGSLKK